MATTQGEICLATSANCCSRALASKLSRTSTCWAEESAAPADWADLLVALHEATAPDNTTADPKREICATRPPCPRRSPILLPRTIQPVRPHGRCPLHREENPLRAGGFGDRITDFPGPRN